MAPRIFTTPGFPLDQIFLPENPTVQLGAFTGRLILTRDEDGDNVHLVFPFLRHADGDMVHIDQVLKALERVNAAVAEERTDAVQAADR